MLHIKVASGTRDEEEMGRESETQLRNWFLILLAWQLEHSVGHLKLLSTAAYNWSSAPSN